MSEFKRSFEFNEWKEAFETFYKKYEEDNSWRFLISTHWSTSGYWIERNAQNDEHTYVYDSLKKVQELEERVKAHCGGIVSLLAGDGGLVL
jgi:hypothetical protein